MHTDPFQRAAAMAAAARQKTYDFAVLGRLAFEAQKARQAVPSAEFCVHSTASVDGHDHRSYAEQDLCYNSKPRDEWCDACKARKEAQRLKRLTRRRFLEAFRRMEG